MKKGLTELVFILDRSGSMGGLECDTIGGFNSMIERQKKQAGEVNVTTVLFDDRYDVIHDRFPLDVIPPMTSDDYYVRGCTALLDAVGKTIHKVENIQKHLPEEHKAEKVIFVITTDGMENASREYNYEHIKRMIERQKGTYGWEFMFLGANIDAVMEASRFGISPDRAVTYKNESQGVQMNYRVVSETVCSMRSAPQMANVGADWKKEIEEDVKKRG
ncbi:MAG: VWA domain-containing protein [Clostridia bacterium]|nr:VWA domain-containing protein [Lachnospiraceae bacterium]NCC00685.1 VWA domain-containing protein [Clostridia bacterium]NCD02698.1 VWA domain-containing protein [Clostridia bacterium]